MAVIAQMRKVMEWCENATLDSVFINLGPMASLPDVCIHYLLTEQNLH